MHRLVGQRAQQDRQWAELLHLLVGLVGRRVSSSTLTCCSVLRSRTRPQPLRGRPLWWRRLRTDRSRDPAAMSQRTQRTMRRRCRLRGGFRLGSGQCPPASPSRVPEQPHLRQLQRLRWDRRPALVDHVAVPHPQRLLWHAIHNPAHSHKGRPVVRNSAIEPHPLKSSTRRRSSGLRRHTRLPLSAQLLILTKRVISCRLR